MSGPARPKPSTGPVTGSVQRHPMSMVSEGAGPATQMQPKCNPMGQNPPLQGDTRRHTPPANLKVSGTKRTSAVLDETELTGIRVPVSERTWGFKSPLAHSILSVNVLVTWLRSVVTKPCETVVVTGWSRIRGWTSRHRAARTVIAVRGARRVGAPKARSTRGQPWADPRLRPGAPSKMRSLDTSGMPRRTAVAAIQRSASCSRCPRAWPARSEATRRST